MDEEELKTRVRVLEGVMRITHTRWQSCYLTLQ